MLFVTKLRYVHVTAKRNVISAQVFNKKSDIQLNCDRQESCISWSNKSYKPLEENLIECIALIYRIKTNIPSLSTWVFLNTYIKHVLILVLLQQLSIDIGYYNRNKYDNINITTRCCNRLTCYDAALMTIWQEDVNEQKINP